VPSLKKPAQGFILLPVVLAISMIAGLAFLLNREGAENNRMLNGEVALTQAQYIAKAGVNQMLWQANNANCTGYTPASNINFAGYTYSGTIAPTSNSPVSISVTANSAGTTATLKRDLQKVYQSTKTKILQLGNDPGKDAYISSANSTSNFGNGDEGVLATWLFAWFYRNQLIQFDLSAIPSNAHIVSAQLQLYSKSGSGKVNIYRLTHDWTEGTMSGSGTADGVTWKTYDGSSSWATSGGDFAPTLVDSDSVDSSANGFQSWELAPLVQDWLAGKYPNYGVLLKATGLMSAAFAGKEDATPAYRPKLVITYNCECGLNCSNCLVGNVNDNFSTLTYAGSNGSLPWTGNWLETGEADGPTTGKLSVLSALQCTSGNCLKIRKDIATVVAINRGLNLASAVTATLNFNYLRNVVLIPGGGAVTVEASKDGTTFTSLKSYPLDATDFFATAESIDISNFLSSQSQIRFITSGASFQSNIYIDNINVAVSCTAPPATAHTVTLTSVADSYLNEASVSSNYGSATSLTIGTNSLLKRSAGLVKFDVSSVPTTATVTKARLRVFVTASTGAGSIPIGVYKLLANWSESTVNWTNYSNPAYASAVHSAVTTAPLASPVVLEWSLPTTLINEWRDYVPTPNYGLVFYYEGLLNNLNVTIASKENTSVALRPQLVIDYTQP